MLTKRIAFTMASGGQAAPIFGLMVRRIAFTTTDWLNRFYNRFACLRSAFTMAEILLSLTIIGVVAAITLPSLTGNINERTWNTQRKALYSRMSQAIALMPSLNGYGAESFSETNDTVAETFITAGLSKVLKINNVCDVNHLQDCGIASEYITLTGSKLAPPTNTFGLNCNFLYSYNSSYYSTNAAAFETVNGESIITYYKPNCLGKDKINIYHNSLLAEHFVCANFVYDLNGTKGPNTLGKDIGIMTALYPFDTVLVAPMPLNKDTTAVTHQQTGAACKNLDEDSRVPNVEEAISIATNRILVNGFSEVATWTSTLYDTNKALYLPYLQHLDRTQAKTVRCIKR